MLRGWFESDEHRGKELARFLIDRISRLDSNQSNRLRLSRRSRRRTSSWSAGWEWSQNAESLSCRDRVAVARRGYFVHRDSPAHGVMSPVE